jgi:hypothetical protein
MIPSLTERTPANLNKFNAMLRKIPITNAALGLEIWQLSNHILYPV